MSKVTETEVYESSDGMISEVFKIIEVAAALLSHQGISFASLLVFAQKDGLLQYYAQASATADPRTDALEMLKVVINDIEENGDESVWIH